jgi:hypothetical protein
MTVFFVEIYSKDEVYLLYEVVAYGADDTN